MAWMRWRVRAPFAPPFLDRSFMNPKLFCYLSIPVILFRCSQNKNPIVGNIFIFTDENPLM